LIKAVFFDWFNTLARFDPPREELYSQVLGEFGIGVSPQKLMPGVFAADNYWFEENARSAIRDRSPEEQKEINIHYQKTLLAEVGINASRELLLKIVKRMRELFSGVTFVLFDDVLAVLPRLKQRGLILGLLTNLARDMVPICNKLGLESHIDFTVTSGEVGVDKPDPLIFLAALERAGVNAAETIHVGDQYKVDVIGARGVGIAPILMDRYNLHPEVSDCPRIVSLTELNKYL
jgi:putative hydrolase of the HAD superfamily